MNMLTAVEHLGADVLKGIEWPFHHAAALAALIGDGLKKEPEVKTVVVTLVQKFEAIGPDALAAYASKGANIGADVATAEDVKAAFSYFTGTFLPVVEAAYKTLKADAKIPAGTDPATLPAAVEAATEAVLTPGPGLHTVVPA